VQSTGGAKKINFRASCSQLLLAQKKFFNEHLEHFFKEKKWPKVLNRHTKWQRRQREKLLVKALHSAICRQKNFPREYFLATDRADVYIIKGHKNLISHHFASHSKVVHSEDHFSEEGLFRSRFSKSSFKFKRKWKLRVPSHTSVSKYYADKTYANLWFIWQIFMKSDYNKIWSTYFSQQAPRIHHIETHVTNIC